MADKPTSFNVDYAMGYVIQGLHISVRETDAGRLLAAWDKFPPTKPLPQLSTQQAVQLALDGVLGGAEVREQD
jgi:hypothetical protein